MKKQFIIFTALAIVFCGCVEKRPEIKMSKSKPALDEMGRWSGRIALESGLPASNIKIVLVKNLSGEEVDSAVTDKSGCFTFDNIREDGEYKIGYDDGQYSLTIELSKGAHLSTREYPCIYKAKQIPVIFNFIVPENIIGEQYMFEIERWDELYKDYRPVYHNFEYSKDNYILNENMKIHVTLHRAKYRITFLAGNAKPLIFNNVCFDGKEKPVHFDIVVEAMKSPCDIPYRYDLYDIEQAKDINTYLLSASFEDILSRVTLIRRIADDDIDSPYLAGVCFHKIVDYYFYNNKMDLYDKQFTQAEYNNLIAQLSSSDPKIRAITALTLGYKKYIPAIPQIIDLLKDDDWGVSSNAVFALGIIGSDKKTVVDALCNALYNLDFRVRITAIKALVKINAKQSASYLALALKDKESKVRIAAARALYKIGDKSIVPDLLKSLHDNNPSVRCEAAGSLSYIADKAAINELEKLAYEDKDERVRESAVYAIGFLSGKAECPILMNFLDDESVLVSEAAYVMLLKISSKDFGYDTEKWREWWEADKATRYKKKAENK